jgi:hypothetical protein
MMIDACHARSMSVIPPSFSDPFVPGTRHHPPRMFAARLLRSAAPSLTRTRLAVGSALAFGGAGMLAAASAAPLLSACAKPAAWPEPPAKAVAPAPPAAKEEKHDVRNVKFAFDSKAAFVTGGGHGIGRAICVQMAEAGCNVLVADINLTTAEETAGLCRKANPKVKVIPMLVDVRKYEQVAARLCPFQFHSSYHGTRF